MGAGAALGVLTGDLLGDRIGDDLCPRGGAVLTPEEIYATGEHGLWAPPANITFSGSDTTGWTNLFTGSSVDFSILGNAPAYTASGGDGPGATAYASGDNSNGEGMRALSVTPADTDIEVFLVARSDAYLNARLIANYAPIILRQRISPNHYRSESPGPAPGSWSLDSTVEPASAWVGMRAGYSDSLNKAWFQVSNETLLEATSLDPGSQNGNFSLFTSIGGSQPASVSLAHVVAVRVESTSLQLTQMATYFNSVHGLSLTWS